MDSPEEISKESDCEDVVKSEKKSTFVNEMIFFTVCPIFFLISGIFYYEAYFRELEISDMVDWHWETTTLRGGILSTALIIRVLIALLLIRGLRKYTNVESVISKKLNDHWALMFLPIVFCIVLLSGMQFVWEQYGDKGTADAKEKLTNSTKVIYSLKTSSSEMKEAEFLYKSSTDVVCLRSLNNLEQFFIHYHSFDDFSYFEIIKKENAETP
ncbi:MAG: hypothetical protein ACSHX0_06105 [Akkermansiaceae bacterium]